MGRACLSRSSGTCVSRGHFVDGGRGRRRQVQIVCREVGKPGGGDSCPGRIQDVVGILPASRGPIKDSAPDEITVQDITAVPAGLRFREGERPEVRRVIAVHRVMGDRHIFGGRQLDTMLLPVVHRPRRMTLLRIVAPSACHAPVGKFAAGDAGLPSAMPLAQPTMTLRSIVAP